MAKEVNRYLEELVYKNRALGELGHPENPTINLERVSHKIMSLKEDGNQWIGRALVLETPMGKTARTLAYIDAMKRFRHYFPQNPESIVIFGAGVWLLSNDSDKSENEGLPSSIDQYYKSQPPVYLISMFELGTAMMGIGVNVQQGDMANAKKSYDDFSKKFTADDSFELIITGLNNKGEENGIVKFKLANGTNILDTWELDLGVVGPSALGEEVQNNFHKLIGVPG